MTEKIERAIWEAWRESKRAEKVGGEVPQVTYEDLKTYADRSELFRDTLTLLKAEALAARDASAGHYLRILIIGSLLGNVIWYGGFYWWLP